jgi:phage baseplate assembly protein gpV
MKQKKSKTRPKDQTGDTDNRSSRDTNTTDYDNSAIYIYNRETGKWEVRNPAGSIGYNYLYRDE